MLNARRKPPGKSRSLSGTADPLRVENKVETIEDNVLGADLFGTMLRCVEMEKQRRKDEADNERADDKAGVKRSGTRAG
jgi:hypothetical protein